MFLKTKCLFIFSILTVYHAAAQKGGDSYKSFKPDIKRDLFHSYVDREQRNALKADGRADNQFTLSADEDINYLVTQALTQKVDQLQYDIEKDTEYIHSRKVAYLRGLENMLKNFTASIRPRSFMPSNWPAVVDAYADAMKKDAAGQSIELLVDSKGYDVGIMLINSGAFNNNSGYQGARFSLTRKYAQLHPNQILTMLNKNPDLPFRDSLIVVAAYKYPKQLYDYAAADNKLGFAIRKIDDPLVRTVSKMAKSGGSGQMYFPFLDNILKGTQTIEEIDKVKNDGVKYYKLLVKTRMDYMARIRQGETVYELEGLTRKLEDKAKDVFIKEINGLHESPDAVRFKILNQLTGPELYYVAIGGESEIYTSSFTKGVYPAMLQKMGNRGDSLLYAVGFDRFKKFIRMAAGYNTLNDFLKTFTRQDDARLLMTAFVNGLERSEGLEDGVDVADSYVSIFEGNKELAKSVLALAKENLDKNLAQNNKRGIVMYNLLYKLFLSADSSNNINLSKEFGIPPVYNVSYNTLENEKEKKVVMQVFFYGDEDGKMSYNGFLPTFNNANWKKTDDNKNWVSFTSVKGKPIIVYANKWADDEKQPGELEKKQAALNNYLAEKEIEPTIVVHRGHSYWVASTIEQIKPSAKIVLLGSCGGYNVIHDVLKNAPDAHIIASKQTGKKDINQPFLNILNDKIRNGSNIEWIPFWNEFKARAGKIEGFEDYIPPFRNLGAIFIKAYNSQMGDGSLANN